MDQNASLLARLAAVGFGGCLGAISRYGISEFIRRRLPGDLPVGTLLANLIGCFLIGMMMAVFRFEWDQIALRSRWLSSWQESEHVRLLLVTGFLGSLTTFSTFSDETFELYRRSSHGWATLHVLMSVVGGLLCVWTGRSLMLSILE